jgi:hypothetical protein
LATGWISTPPSVPVTARNPYLKIKNTKPHFSMGFCFRIG